MDTNIVAITNLLSAIRECEHSLEDLKGCAESYVTHPSANSAGLVGMARAQMILAASEIPVI
ncbi:hypothetical protein [Rhodococcus sp. EPR-157]|uniref:hypothetical protein n=1 Tax=Rhodococcus sp. EPR-157 TaxID=1813677 RepID=UPI000A446C86|nr:hypothetical protein [Rhodococcus sp. EPR-157]